MKSDRQVEDLTANPELDTAELDDLVRELDAILDAWFMTETTPALVAERRAGHGAGTSVRAA